MAIKWLDKKSKTGIATISNTAITLNSKASICFSNSVRVMIGIDSKEGFIAIKGIDATTLSKKDIDNDLLYKITITNSYGRVTSKILIKEILETYNLVLEGKEVIKYPTIFNEETGYLIIYLGKGV